VIAPLDGAGPTRVGDFDLLCRIGAGGFGEVYLGRSRTWAGQLAAVKIAHPDIVRNEGFRQRFTNEVRAMGTVVGDGVPRLLDADSEAEKPWLATEFLRAPALQDLVGEGGPLPPEVVWRIAEQASAAIVRMHELGVYHRDIKPSNVLIGRDRAWLIDFGLVRLVGDPRLTRTGDRIGSLQYMSPEHVAGLAQAAGPSDVFALGGTLLYALTGHPPYDGASIVTVLRKISSEAPDTSGLPDGDLAGLIRRCLVRHPDGRPTAVWVNSVARRHVGRTADAGTMRLPGDPVPLWRTLPPEHRRLMRDYDRRIEEASGGAVPRFDGEPTAVVGAAVAADEEMALGVGPFGPSAPGSSVDPGGSVDLGSSADPGSSVDPGGFAGPRPADGRSVPPRTGGPRPDWEWRGRDWIRCPPVLSAGVVAIAHCQGRVVGLDAENGRERWELPAESGDLVLPGAMAVVSGRLVVGTGRGRLRIVHASSGKREHDLWVGPTVGSAGTGVAVHGVCVTGADTVLATMANGDLVSARLDAMAARTAREAVGPVRRPAVCGATVVTAGIDGCVRTWEFGTGIAKCRAKWRLDGAILGGPLAVGQAVVCGTATGTLWLVEPPGGTARVLARLGTAICGDPAVSGDGLVVAGTSGGDVVAVYASGVKGWRESLGEPVVAVAADEQWVYAALRGGSVHVLGRDDGARAHTIRTPAACVPAAAGREGERRLYTAGLDGTVRRYTIP
jgi:serine/threonine protein kinase/outer membrane protein assembly factor BamB